MMFPQEKLPIIFQYYIYRIAILYFSHFAIKPLNLHQEIHSRRTTDWLSKDKLKDEKVDEVRQFLLHRSGHTTLCQKRRFRKGQN